MASNNLTPEEILQIASTMSKKGGDAKQAEALKDMVMKKLSPEQSNTLNMLLNDKPALDKLLQSEEAKSLIEKLTGKKPV